MQGSILRVVDPIYPNLARSGKDLKFDCSRLDLRPLEALHRLLAFLESMEHSPLALHRLLAFLESMAPLSVRFAVRLSVRFAVRLSVRLAERAVA